MVMYSIAKKSYTEIIDDLNNNRCGFNFILDKGLEELENLIKYNREEVFNNGRPNEEFEQLRWKCISLFDYVTRVKKSEGYSSEEFSRRFELDILVYTRRYRDIMRSPVVSQQKYLVLVRHGKSPVLEKDKAVKRDKGSAHHKRKNGFKILNQK